MGARLQHGHFRKVTAVEAAQYPGHTVEGIDTLLAFEDWLCEKQAAAGVRCKYRGQQLIIPTLEGELAADPGAWIVVGVRGELHPVEREIFAQTYQRVQG